MPWSQQLLRLPRGVRRCWGHLRWPGTGSIIEPWSCWCLGSLTALRCTAGCFGHWGHDGHLKIWERCSKLNGLMEGFNDLFKNDLISATLCL